ncbi:stage III sporulation protein AD [Anoxybacter fermentans]|uniref:Stage III sporulation protein AD n=1 Tax=Anoxybacter fermentans TaxID=1323375 RepID=A0A3S9SZ71_9FIRM|nr:stage III sporulation protein AD [Anoxybacter fermentans]AZR73548.1 stage III sporulation protein AD [Anoxybacter fermentans]
MEIFQIVGVGIITTILIMVIKEHKPEIAIQLTILVGVLIFILMMDKITGVVNVLRQLAIKANISLTYITTIFKIIGIAYIAEFGAQICRDAGEGVIAAKIEFAAKILIMIIALPIMIAIMESIVKILP